MSGFESFPLAPLDYLAIGGFFAMLSVVGYLAGRGEQAGSTEYFLAGKKLPLVRRRWVVHRFEYQQRAVHWNDRFGGRLWRLRLDAGVG